MKQNNIILFFLILVISCGFLTSCATMFASDKAPAVLVGAPQDLKITDNGEIVTTKLVQSQVKTWEGTSSRTTTTYFALGFDLSKKVRKHKLVLESEGKTGTVVKKMNIDASWFVLDMFVAGIPGYVIDGISKKWKHVKKRHIDVPAVLNGTRSHSQRILKKVVRRQAKGRKLPNGYKPAAL